MRELSHTFPQLLVVATVLLGCKVAKRSLPQSQNQPWNSPGIELWTDPHSWCLVNCELLMSGKSTQNIWLTSSAKVVSLILCRALYISNCKIAKNFWCINSCSSTYSAICVPTEVLSERDGDGAWNKCGLTCTLPHRENLTRWMNRRLRHQNF